MEENRRRRDQDEKQKRIKEKRDADRSIHQRAPSSTEDAIVTEKEIGTEKARNEFGREMGPLDLLLCSIREGNYQLKRGERVE